MEAALTRWRIDLGYDGTDFSGWAKQTGTRTVQGELETRIPQVLRLDEPVTLTCAGRTDAGVHARGQVAHFDLPAEVITDRGEWLKHRLDRVLPADISIARVSPAPPGFDARFSAIWRRYIYRLAAPGEVRDPLLRGHVTALRQEVDLDAMNAAATSLLGLRDFAAFCRRKDGGTTVRTLLTLAGEHVTSGPYRGVIEFTVVADAFCHSMVRSLIGALVGVGTGHRDLDWLHRALNSTVRESSITVMAAHGLTLEEVGYPPDDQLHSRSVQARAVREASR